MRKEKIFTLENCYRDDMDVYGFHFGKGEKAACIEVPCGATRCSSFISVPSW